MRSGARSSTKGWGAHSRLPYTLHPTPYTLHPTPYTLHPAPYTLHPTPYTLTPYMKAGGENAGQTRNPKSETLEPKPQTPEH